MSFYMAMPTNCGFIKTTGKQVWTDGYMSAWEHSGRLYMLHGDMLVAELIGGNNGLTKYYRGSFEIWRNKIKAKDMAKVERMQKEADNLLSQCNEISAMWINSPAT